MMMNDYVAEKLRALDEARLSRTLIANGLLEGGSPNDRSKARPVIGPVLRVTGRTLRRMGAGLEHWAEPPASEAEQLWVSSAGPGRSRS